MRTAVLFVAALLAHHANAQTCYEAAADRYWFVEPCPAGTVPGKFPAPRPLEDTPTGAFEHPARIAGEGSTFRVTSIGAKGRVYGVWVPSNQYVPNVISRRSKRH